MKTNIFLSIQSKFNKRITKTIQFNSVLFKYLQITTKVISRYFSYRGGLESRPYSLDHYVYRETQQIPQPQNVKLYKKQQD